MERSGLENIPEERLSFEEAKTFLEGKLDLEKELSNAIKMHERWGLIDKFIAYGFVKDADAYRQLFYGVSFNKQDLQILTDGLAQGAKVLTVFAPEQLSLSLIWERLIMEVFAISYPNYALSQLPRITKIKPNDLNNLSELNKSPQADQIAAFKSAYAIGDTAGSFGSRILFTPDTPEASRTESSPTKEVQLIAEKKLKLIDPIADIMRFRDQIDNGLSVLAAKEGIDFDNLSKVDYKKLLHKCLEDKTLYNYFPDREKITHYPEYVLENGSVLQLYFNEEEGLVYLGYGYPDGNTQGGNRISGSRVALGL